jgi:hypothetical protein
VTTAEDEDPYASILPLERAELILAGTLAGMGASDPVAIVGQLLAALDRNGLTVVIKPPRQI